MEIDRQKQGVSFKDHFRKHVITHVVGLAMIFHLARVPTNRLSFELQKKEKNYLPTRGYNRCIPGFVLSAVNSFSDTACSTFTFFIYPSMEHKHLSYKVSLESELVESSNNVFKMRSLCLHTDIYIYINPEG